MNILLDQSILYATALAALAWFLIRKWVEPRQLKTLATAPPDQRPKAAARAAASSTLRGIAAAVAIAGALVIAGTYALRAYVTGLPSTEEGLEKLVQMRGALDGMLDWAAAISLGLWAGILAALALVWIVVASRRARKRWTAAEETRRAALEARYRDVAEQELRENALASDPDGLGALDAHILELDTARKDAVTELRILPMIEMGEEGEKVSLQDLSNLADAMRAPREAETDAPPDADAPDPQETAAAAERLVAQVAQMKQDIHFDIDTLNGPRSVSLAEAEAGDMTLVASSEDVQSALRGIIVASELKRQEDQAGDLPASEPEFFREWVSAVLTGEQAAKLGGRIGSGARTVLLVVLLLGLIGLGGQMQAPAAQAALAEVEIGLGRELTDAELSAAMGRAQPEEQETTEQSTELASDSETAQQLRTAMRAGVARALHSGQFVQPQAMISRRQSFDLAAIDARQRILSASARPAPSASRNVAAAAEYRPVLPDTSDAYQAFDELLEETIERRIDRMRGNEATWRRMRASAARPARADLVGEQFLRAAFTGDRLPAPMAMRAWTEQATLDVARAAVRTGNIPHGYTPTARIDGYVELVSARDRRLIADFEARAPRNVAGHLGAVHDGRIDPGSIHRAALDAPGRPAGRTSSAYADLFPSVADAASGGGGGGGGGDARAKAKPRGGGGGASARSYTKIRFNRRVGGVVIGRMPDPDEGNHPVTLTGFDWKIENDLLEVVLTTPETGPLSLGRFSPAIAHHAMAYAADGRVVTSTLPQVLPPENTGGHTVFVPTRRIVVHPAFEDTAFGCSAIDVDRFVDITMRVDAAAELAVDRDAVTFLGRILNFSYSNRNSPDYSRQATAVDVAAALPDLSPYVKRCGAGGDCFPLRHYGGNGTNFSGANALLACVAASADPASSCLDQANALANIASYSVDSGVRELPYSLTRDLAFLRADMHAGDVLWPLNFIVQAVPVALTDTDLDLPETLEPWTFPAWEDDLRQLVAQTMLADPVYAQVMRDMREFTVLQRLFRLALSGDLGLDVPLGPMVEMQEATRDYVRPLRHPHWNVSHFQPFPEFVEVVQAEEDGLAYALYQITQDAGSGNDCQQRAQSQLARYQEARWPAGTSLWEGLTDVAAACEGDYAASDFFSRFDALKALELDEEAIAIARGMKGEVTACP